MFKGELKKHTLKFKQPSGTSRGVLTEKDTWFISIWDDSNPSVKGMGEASIIKTLSPDWSVEYPSFLQKVVKNIDTHISNGLVDLLKYPSIYFAIEMALLDLENGGNRILFESEFTKNHAPIKINGLIWMGDKSFMRDQIEEKLANGYTCIKLKIGAIDFKSELLLLDSIRSNFDKDKIELRVDANGAFTPDEALGKLNDLVEFDLHSIEQPIKQGQSEAMKKLCASTPLPIALDEELIGTHSITEKNALLKEIQPQFIILKPSLIGGFKETDEWIESAEKHTINWWITSALESNIGLNAIAQYTYTKHNPLPQGLGTGQLYTNNIPSPLTIENGKLFLA